ncbi:Non-catalytic module family DOC2 [Piromyces sp. E2]|nr:Non-catalytic module family DOC2 [Piromyces sp. E2]|eukprot:OUM61515.1 Non-catalytic module family DOC2 [Piromyces sp. E2]
MKNIPFCFTLLIAIVKAKSITNNETCWSKVALGIKCCPEGTKANYFDEYGDWYKKDLNSDVRTCGIIDGYCWSIAKDEKGSNYPCCVEKHDPSDYYKDGEGDWSQENGQWCTIRHTNKPWNDRELIEETRDEWNAFKKIWEKERYNFERISVFVGDNESKINFAWYSKEKYTPMIRISKNKDMSDAKTYEGTSEEQTDRKFNDKVSKGFEIISIKINGEKYYTNRVTVKDIERNTSYYYQRYIRGKWEPTIKYKTYDDKNFKFIFVGDPQIGGGHHRYRPYPQFLHPTTLDEGNMNDSFNWERALNSAFSVAKTPSVLLSAGDQADEMGDYTQITNQESQYSGFLYPDVLKKIVMATSVGNHEVNTNSYGRHFNVPNPLTNSTITRYYDGWYTGYNYFFKYNNVLVVVLETNNNEESDYRIAVRNAIMKYPDTDWRIALFHHDIFGNGNTHSQSDSLKIRGVIFNVLSKYKFDLVINGHDHVYTSTKFVSYDNIVNEDANSAQNYKPSEIKKNVVNKNPKGTLFVTANCSSGSKFMDFYKNPDQNYVFNYTQTFTPTFGILDFTQSNGKVRLSITTYEVESQKVVDGSYIIEKDAGSNGKKVYLVVQKVHNQPTKKR